MSDQRPNNVLGMCVVNSDATLASGDPFFGAAPTHTATGVYTFTLLEKVAPTDAVPLVSLRGSGSDSGCEAQLTDDHTLVVKTRTAGLAANKGFVLCLMKTKG